MKQVVKIILAAAAIVALAVPAMAADKLIVKNAAGTANVFRVADDGTLDVANGGVYYNPTTKFLGVGTSTPGVDLNVVRDISTGGTVMWVDGIGEVGFGPNIAIRTARGAKGAMNATQLNDIVGQVNFRGASGTNGSATFAPIRRSGFVSYATENYTSTAQGTNLTFVTTANGTTTPTEKLFITGDGKIGIGTGSPTSILHVVGLPVYADNTAATAGGLTAGAFYRTSTGVLMVRY